MPNLVISLQPSDKLTVSKNRDGNTEIYVGNLTLIMSDRHASFLATQLNDKPQTQINNGKDSNHRPQQNNCVDCGQPCKNFTRCFNCNQRQPRR